nr:hypothetical protein [Spirochaeta sp.]
IQNIWKVHSSKVTKKELELLDAKWEEDRAKYLQLTGSQRPIAALAGDYFGKLKKILLRSKWQYSEIDQILVDDDKQENVKNTRNKLEFLMNLGVVSSYDDKIVHINPHQKEDYRNPIKLFELLQEHLGITL